MKTKNLKSLLQVKQKIISREEGYPSKASGRDGDFQIRRISGQGIFLFYKWHSKWYSTRLTQYRPKTAEHKEPVKLPIGVKSTKPGELSLDSTGNVAIKKTGNQLNHIISYDDDGLADTNTIKFSRANTATVSAGSNDDLLLYNTGHSRITLKSGSATYDPYINYVYSVVGETPTWHGWAVGMDSSDTKTFKWRLYTGPATTTPSTAGDAELELDGSGNLKAEGTLSGSRTAVGNSDYICCWDGTTLKYRSGANVKSDFGVPTNYITNDAADIMTVSDFGANAALKIDADQPDTPGAEDSKGLWIDYVRAVATSGTAAHNDIGIDLDVTSRSLGTSSVKGMDIDVVGHTDGTHIATGLEINVSGADKNYALDITSSSAQLRIRAATDPDNDMASFYVTDGGNLTINTAGDGATDSDLILDIDGAITLDAGSGEFIAKNNGTEFSAADSAYAGMILGYTRIANNGTGSGDAYILMDATLTVLQTVDASTNVSIAFVVPPSGNVEIQFSCQVYASSKTVEFALSDSTTFNEISETHTYDAGVQSSDETDINMVYVAFTVTGLTAGASLTYYIAGAETSSGTTSIRHGRYRATGNHYPPIIVKAIALPATIVTGG